MKVNIEKIGTAFCYSLCKATFAAFYEAKDPSVSAFFFHKIA